MYKYNLKHIDAWAEKTDSLDLSHVSVRQDDDGTSESNNLGVTSVDCESILSH